MTNQGTQQYYRTDSNDSAASMLRAGDREECCKEPGEKVLLGKGISPLWVLVAFLFIVVLQVACCTGLYVYFSMSISKLKAQTQGMSEELRCLQIINRMEDISDPSEFERDGLLPSESCQKLARSITSYVTQVTENAIQRTARREAAKSFLNNSGIVIPRGLFTKTSAHLILQNTSVPAQNTKIDEATSQSCRNPIRQWEFKHSNSPLAHMQNMSYQDGRLKILQDGKYYVYSQIYFRYPQNQKTSTNLGQQLVQCVNKKTAYATPLLLLKGVGTKCWAPNAQYGLHSVHQAGIFELRFGDELFVTVSSLDMLHGDETSSFFGAFRLDA
ncbi:tumor necrosis factor ligand superfamily member 10-like isoform X2 [Pseudophryne corroboree]|uniref:tumor necrosis factor ligand superfamily member 10-like isoform X2 n=1 Tax=Pseudophryne corroboree TaxID=495146 RepID=UPI003081F70C